MRASTNCVLQTPQKLYAPQQTLLSVPFFFLGNHIFFSSIVYPITIALLLFFFSLFGFHVFYVFMAICRLVSFVRFPNIHSHDHVQCSWTPKPGRFRSSLTWRRYRPPGRHCQISSM
ncbi:hypothetical protein DICVIV_12522 [Dictyocaulus viviparus]|uniref:Uncharacterized protein n=1 Tax=Dictyocaulus viviparus TaxID=29172 RepID=A0A0D8XA97_DICVI|nr:hypothetical protein DICVIV_12522 [Dictyocaulus viviparus]